MKRRLLYYNKIKFQISTSEEVDYRGGLKEEEEEIYKEGDCNFNCGSLISLFRER